MAAEVAVGRVGKPLGLRGDVYVHPDPDLADQFPPGATYRTAGRSLRVATSRMHGNRRVVRFEGVDSREAAEALRGAVLMIDRGSFGREADVYWADELVGRDVVTAGGEPVGTLSGVADGAAHDYLVVARNDGEELLIPAVDELVAITPDRIVVQHLPGLLDDTAEG